MNRSQTRITSEKTKKGNTNPNYVKEQSKVQTEKVEIYILFTISLYEMMLFDALDGWRGDTEKHPYSPFAKRPTLSLSDRRRIRAHASSPPTPFNSYLVSHKTK